MRRKLADHFPLGTNIVQQCAWAAFGWIGSTVFSCGRFFFRFWSRLNSLTQWFGPEKNLKMMPDFSEVISGTMAGFWIVICCAAALAVYNYYYHYNDSKSIYLMRRLPNAGELHRRCLTFPLLVILISLGIVFFLLCVYYKVYMTCTPAEYLPPDRWERIRRL